MTAPHNAGLSFDVPNEVVGPVSTIDFGMINVTENWGRLFIKQGDQQIILLRSAYPNFVATIEQFIEPDEKEAS